MPPPTSRPIATASRYLGSAVSNGLSIVTPSVLPKKDEDLAIVYPLASTGFLNQGCLQGSCTARVTGVGSDVSGALPLTLSNSFAKDSQGRRVYFASRQVRYCVQGAVLTRASAAIGTDITTSPTALMTEHIRPAVYYFYRDPAAFSPSEVGLRLVFEQRGESVSFNHKLEVLNVP